MAHLTISVEYALHCLLWLVDAGDTPLSSRDLAELQGVSPTFLAKILPRLEKAGIVRACGGRRGGYLLARPARAVRFLDVVDAVEGVKPLFDCREVRTRCALFGERPPGWATAGVCAIHAVMLRAEQSLRDTLAGHSLADVAQAFAGKAPASFVGDLRNWLKSRREARAGPRKRRRSTAARAKAASTNRRPSNARR
jgi:Rrf2 family protein